MEESLKIQTKKGLYWAFINQFAGYIVQFVVGIILARLLTPEDYGITALPTVFILVSMAFIDSGFASALIRKPELTEKDLSTAFYYSILIGLSCYTVLFLASPYIADFYDAPILKSVLRVTAITMLLSPISSIQYVQLTRKLDFKTQTKISLFCSIIAAVLGISMACMGYGIWSLIVPSVVSSCISIPIYYWYLGWYPSEKWSKESFRYLWGYGNKMLASSLLDKIYSNIYPLVIGKYYNTYDLGLYNRAQSYARLPSQQITGVLQKVTFPVLSKMQKDDDALERNYRRILRTSAFIVFPVMLMLSALAHPIVIVMVTEKWTECIILLQILCFSMMWYPIHAINLNLLQVKGRSDLFLRLEIIKKIIGVCFMIVTIPMGLIWIVTGSVVNSLISLAFNTYYTGKLIHVGFVRQMKDLFPSVLMSVSMWGLIHVINSFIDNYYVQIIVGMIVGSLYYIVVSFIFKRPELQDAMYMLKRKADYEEN